MKPSIIFSVRKVSLKVLFTLALLVLFSLSFLLIKRISNMSQAADWVNHTNVTRLALSETLSLLKDAEADQRGFLLSGDSSFLNNCNFSKDCLNNHFDTLRALMSDNPGQLKQVDTLQVLVNKRLELLQSLLAVHGKTAPSTGTDLKKGMLVGKHTMDAVKSRLQLMENIEQQLLKQRITESRHYVFTTPLLAMLLTIAALLIIILAFNKLRKQLSISNHQGQLANQEAQKRAYLVEQVVENNIDMIMVLDTELRLTIWNKALEEAFGLPRHEVLGRKITDVFPYLEGDIKIRYSKEALQGKETIRQEVPFLRSQRIGQASYIPLKDTNGNIEGVLIITHDITELKQATEFQKENNIRFEQAEEAGQLGSYRRNVQTGEVVASKNMYRLFGFEPGSIIPNMEMFYKMVHPDDQQQTIQTIQSNLSSGVFVPIRCRIIRNDGATRYIKASAIHVQNEKGEMIIYGSILDNTDEELLKQQLEEINAELKEKNRQLQQSNEELTSFNFIASHDLQEPLRKIQTFASFLEETEEGLSEQGRNNVKRMLAAATRMRALINDLLAFSLVDIQNEEPERVDLNSIVQCAQSSLRTALDEKGAIIKASQLPEVQGTSFQLQQLFENIIGNAVKYCDPGTTPVVNITSAKVPADKAATIGLQPGTSYYQICFRDNGIGFEQEYAGKIFELFQRLHTQSHYPGTGLGLAICRKIVQHHHGHIRATSHPGEGSLFEIFLPVAAVREAA
jgi:PAS domain S-box-containing protein